LSKNIIKKYEIFLAKNQYFKTNIALESKKIIKTFGLRGRKVLFLHHSKEKE